MYVNILIRNYTVDFSVDEERQNKQIWSKIYFPSQIQARVKSESRGKSRHPKLSSRQGVAIIGKGFATRCSCDMTSSFLQTLISQGKKHRQKYKLKQGFLLVGKRVATRWLP